MTHSSLASQLQARVSVAALNYKNPQIVARLVEEYDMTADEAQELFDDTVKFLALSGGSLKLSPTARIDLGWHNFILHTRDYAAFCQTSFGGFIHHEPGSAMTGSGVRLSVDETVALARKTYGQLSANWESNVRGATCGSNGC